MCLELCYMRDTEEDLHAHSLLSPQEQTCEVSISPPRVRTQGVKELFSWMQLTGRVSVPHSKATPSRTLCAGLEG